MTNLPHSCLSRIRFWIETPTSRRQAAVWPFSDGRTGDPEEICIQEVHDQVLAPRKAFAACVLGLNLGGGMPGVGECPPNSFRNERERLFHLPGTNHLIILINDCVLVQRIDANGESVWTVPFVQYAPAKRYPGDTVDFAEVFLFGSFHLATRHLLELDCNPGPISETHVSTVELSREAEEWKISTLVEQSDGNLRLMDAEDLVMSPFKKFKNGEDLKGFALEALKTPTDITATTRLPWEHRGWIRRARAWIVEHLEREHDACDEKLVLSVKKSWELGFTAHLREFSDDVKETAAATVWWFKATPTRRYSQELPPTVFDKSLRYLQTDEVFATHYATKMSENLELTPDVIAVDRDRGFLLKEDGGGPVPEDDKMDGTVRAALADTVQRYITFQQSTAAKVGQMLTFGIDDRRLERVETILRSTLRETSVPDMPVVDERLYGLLAMRLRGVKKYSGKWEAVFVHGDLNRGNWLYNPKTRKVGIIDWSEACVAHPLVDCLRLNQFDGKMTSAYLKAYGFPPRAERDAKLLQHMQDTVNYCIAHDSAPLESETRQWAVSWATHFAVSFINELEGAEDE